MVVESDRPKILFLCTGNSARSIFAEYLTKKIGRDRFEAYSAGSQPAGAVNPFAIRVLQEQYGIDTRDARSKSWDEFKGARFDIIITVCDNARESCPLFPGQPILTHWSIADPYIRSVANYHIGDHVYVTPISRAFWNEDHRSLIPLTRIKGRLSRPVRERI